MFKVKTARALLDLGRVSNLPTVWSNCMAGWLLGMGDIRMDDIDTAALGLLLVGATLIYLGGMFLNDACDAAWDRRHRPERPIPSGAIAERTVWRAAIGLLAAGLFGLALPGGTSAVLALLLFNCIFLYDLAHKHLAWSWVLMAACRFFLLLLAASHAHACADDPTPFFQSPVAGLAVWSALVLALYVGGLSCIAKGESVEGVSPRWPCLMLISPVAVTLLHNGGVHRESGVVASAILALWILRSIRSTYWQSPPQPGRTVGALLAGMVLVNMVSLVHAPREAALTFLALFLAALAAQRWVKAT